MHAVELLLRGAAISRAAAEAGFSDHAHLTRTFRRCFGKLPSQRPARMLLHAPFHELEATA
jgi:AraC-like DNA-binding protein